MKKAAVSAAVIMIMLTAGCTGQNTAPKLKFGSSVDCSISCGGRDYRCKLSLVSDDTEKITMTYPQSVEGVTFGRSGGNNTVSMDSLLCRSEGSFLPDDSVPVRAEEIIRYLKKNREEIKLFPDGDGYGNDDLPGMKIRTDENGTLAEVTASGK